jgi:hypothetical protein
LLVETVGQFRYESSAAKSKNANPNFFARNPLVSLISAKKKFGKTCKTKVSVLENKGIFCESNAPNLAKPRPPRILQIGRPHLGAANA